MDYRTRCMNCEHEFDQSHLMKEPHLPCPKCKSKKVESCVFAEIRIRPPLDAGWEYENGGRGRYFPGMEQSIDCKPSAGNYFRSRNEAIESCKRRNFQIIDK